MGKYGACGGVKQESPRKGVFLFSNLLEKLGKFGESVPLSCTCQLRIIRVHTFVHNCVHMTILVQTMLYLGRRTIRILPNDVS